MLHTPYSPPRGSCGTSLSRFRSTLALLVVVQDGQCSVHAGGAIRLLQGHLCAVNVKLTMCLAAASIYIRSRVSDGSGQVPTAVSRWCQTDWSSCGEGWGFGRPSAEKTTIVQGGLSQGPPSFLCGAVKALARRRKQRLAHGSKPRC